MHGYELRKRLNLMLGWGRVLSYGSLYPALKKMLRAQLIEETASTTTTVTRRPRIDGHRRAAEAPGTRASARGQHVIARQGTRTAARVPLPRPYGTPRDC